MDDVVTERICPHCAASTSASGPLEAACPQCGQPLATDEAELIADLRAAFGFGGVGDPDSVSASALLTDGSSARATRETEDTLTRTAALNIAGHQSNVGCIVMEAPGLGRRGWQKPP